MVPDNVAKGRPSRLFGAPEQKKEKRSPGHNFKAEKKGEQVSGEKPGFIPAGTGMMKYREFGIEAPDYEPMTYYSSETEEQDPAEFLANLHGSYEGETASS